jgi:hypothetical protein
MEYAVRNNYRDPVTDFSIIIIIVIIVVVIMALQPYVGPW